MPHLPVPNSIESIAEKLREYPIYSKVSEMIDYVITKAIEEFEDVRLKYSGQDVVRNDVVKEIVAELGYDYVKEVMDTITNLEFNVMLQFIALLNTLKGSRDGLVLILKLLGFDIVIREWFEVSPPAEPDTFELVVVMDSTLVKNPAKTLEKVKIFIREYVFPQLSNVDFKFSLAVATQNVNVAGFTKFRYHGAIIARI